jgi:CelD/BcsL family acetyltransferase involved in cellulose biosynthesis
VSLPASLEEFIEQKLGWRTRKGVRRTIRLMEKDFPGEVRCACFAAPDGVGKCFEEAVKIARKTYQWGLGVGFRDGEEHRKRLTLEAEKGWLRGYILYVKNEPVAFWICTVYQDIAYTGYTGYDPNWSRYRVGIFLLLRFVEDMCRQNVKQLDFGLGTAPYKEEFADTKFDEAIISVFRFGLRGISLNMLRLLTQGPAELVRTLLLRLRLEQKVKKFWRSSATRGDVSEEPSQV